MDGHFSEKINMNNCVQRFFLGNLEIFRYLCTHNRLKFLSPRWGIRPVRVVKLKIISGN